MEDVDHVTLPPLALATGGVDRAAVYRLDESWLTTAWTAPETRVLVVAAAQAAVRADTDHPSLALLLSAEAPDGERYFLGAEDGTAYFAVAVPEQPEPAFDDHPALAGARWAGVREVGALLSDRDAGLLVHAIGLEAWHRAHGFCPRCGQPTVAGAAGHVRRCTACDTEHYPRTDPAVIMLVTDDEDRCLLGTRHIPPVSRWSTLAGFVEPGETLEQAVARETLEEAGVVVDSITYIASQPWPFPYSIMLGFFAHATDPTIDVDGEEIAEARWFSRDELRAAIEAGEMLPPTGLSIARHLVERWYGGPLPLA